DVKTTTTASATLVNALGVSCGGDPLKTGRVNVDFKITPAGRVVVAATGTQPFNLYEVYFVPTGSTSTKDAVKVGQFATDCAGKAIDTRVRPITKAADVNTSAAPQLSSLTGSTSGSGAFFVYSRGPWGSDTNGDCTADRYNTTTSPTDSSASNPLANPALGSLTTGLQFVNKAGVTY
ncbi:MAG: hypothetical protein FJ104_13350, partial [Deltaproteobacteria bacterium]|nr:hypothetical protein [Deltaproteobacteria bacterium]